MARKTPGENPFEALLGGPSPAKPPASPAKKTESRRPRERGRARSAEKTVSTRGPGTVPPADSTEPKSADPVSTRIDARVDRAPAEKTGSSTPDAGSKTLDAGSKTLDAGSKTLDADETFDATKSAPPDSESPARAADGDRRRTAATRTNTGKKAAPARTKRARRRAEPDPSRGPRGGKVVLLQNGRTRKNVYVDKNLWDEVTAYARGRMSQSDVVELALRAYLGYEDE